MLQTMVVNNNRYLIETESKSVDKTCEDILKQYPTNAIVEFVKPTSEDVRPKTLKELIYETKK